MGMYHLVKGEGFGEGEEGGFIDIRKPIENRKSGVCEDFCAVKWFLVLWTTQWAPKETKNA